ncbi:SubName: Full=Related to SET protein (Protein phosphatase 2A inhibitor) {ECO:0000313/EMBL:CCA67976.1} [Serendipita indica DSM 11827]|uniref:Related to SET protein (Protein phosphatase 2A inhibitor) n=1 Tax=Serendipita indica (strain DSM 11827) TaxID=1109443 RepID=G4T9H5_SERID|nr:SubName: Full=Related to SET protein (Protein phosphatase 2A inhibitor) {ECO:0000313/EMBL:CCA67976.1} [Serendipita indica DSM 11827]CCA67976.1 related to SET protein (Protein phosphatase 2A inhibitor) [Serendipita indica DSM 11827]
MSKKRASPGDDAAKTQDLTPELEALLDGLEKEHERLILADEFASIYKHEPFYQKRREAVRKVPDFWLRTLQNDTSFVTLYGNHREDLEALKYLEDMNVVRHKPDPRAFTLEMYFKENPYFTDKVLKKEYKLKNAPSGEQVDGIYDSMLNFNPDTDLVASTTKINWRNDKVNLCKMFPRPTDEDELMDEVPDMGTFFNFFEQAVDESDLGPHLAANVFSNPIPLFRGEIDDDEELEEESSEDEDSDAEEIDLERPKKRAKRG